MEKIAEINHSILVRLPLAIQSILKSLPFADFSVLFSMGALVILLIVLIMNLPIFEERLGKEEEIKDCMNKKEQNVKIKILNTKKNRRRTKSRKNQIESVAEAQYLIINYDGIDHNSDGWKVVEPKKLKKKVE